MGAAEGHDDGFSLGTRGFEEAPGDSALVRSHAIPRSSAPGLGHRTPANAISSNFPNRLKAAEFGSDAGALRTTPTSTGQQNLCAP